MKTEHFPKSDALYLIQKIIPLIYIAFVLEYKTTFVSSTSLH